MALKADAAVQYMFRICHASELMGHPLPGMHVLVCKLFGISRSHLLCPRSSSSSWCSSSLSILAFARSAANVIKGFRSVLVDVAVSRQASAGIHSMVNIALAAFCVNVLQIDAARFGHMHLCRTVQRPYLDSPAMVARPIHS